MPRLLAVLRVMRRQARSVPRQPWLLHALACILALGLAGLFIDLLELAHGYWLSLTVVIMLQLNLVRGLRPLLYMALAVLLVSALMTAIGHSLQRPLLLSALLLPVIFFNRAFQASHYLLFAIQTTLLPAAARRPRHGLATAAGTPAECGVGNCAGADDGQPGASTAAGAGEKALGIAPSRRDRRAN